MTHIFRLKKGQSPLLISMPHLGCRIPANIKSRMHPFAHQSRDTDWYLDQLYHFVFEMDLTVISPLYSRYVIDLNRDPADHSLYPGQDTTELCPTSSFDSQPLYLNSQNPSPDEIQKRICSYWEPYHQALRLEIERLKQKHPQVLLFDAHSIAPEIPRFFEGRLPDINIGTASGLTCPQALEYKLLELAEKSAYTSVANGRFKGGYITREYSQPESRVHTLQLELSQDTYMDLETQSFSAVKAQKIEPFLRAWVQTLLDYLEGAA